MRSTPVARSAWPVLVIVGLLWACATSCDDDSDDGSSGGGTANPVATIQVVNETYRIELATPEIVAHAQRLLDGEDIASIPLGRVVRDDPSVNAPWSWHIDPATLQFADFTIEVCDGLPSYVEDRTVTSPDYCPWSAKVIAIDPGS